MIERFFSELGDFIWAVGGQNAGSPFPSFSVSNHSVLTFPVSRPDQGRTVACHKNRGKLKDIGGKQ